MIGDETLALVFWGLLALAAMHLANIGLERLGRLLFPNRFPASGEHVTLEFVRHGRAYVATVVVVAGELPPDGAYYDVGPVVSPVSHPGGAGGGGGDDTPALGGPGASGL